MTIETPAYDRELLRTLNVLCVEDVDFSRESLAYYLKRRCARVDLAHNGQAGLEMFQANSYDVVLTDLLMPVMDGLEMAQRIKALDPNMPVIVLTAHSDDETRRKAAELGVDSFIAKPFFPEKVAEEIYRCAAAKKTV